MNKIVLQIGTAMISSAAIAFSLSTTSWAGKDDETMQTHTKYKPASSVQLGPRPFFLINDMDHGPLKKKLESCETRPFKRALPLLHLIP